MADDVLARLHRLYAAVADTLEDDLSKFPPAFFGNDRVWGVFQDFMGGLSQAQIENLADAVIRNIAVFPEHLRAHCRQRDIDPAPIASGIAASFALRVLIDLDNREKHVGPPRNHGYSGRGPHLGEVSRAARLSTGPVAGSSVAMFLTPRGVEYRTTGGGTATVVVTAPVIGDDEQLIGDLYDIAAEAVSACEAMLADLGLAVPRAPEA